MDLDWDSVSDFISAFPVLEELILKENKCIDFENIRFDYKDLPSLQTLNIESNKLKDFKGILENFASFDLRKLNINHNEIEEVGKI